MDAATVFALHLASTWALVGLIWIVQVVVYPGFAHVGERAFRAAHDHHCTRMTWVVAPLMGCELVTGVALVLERPPTLSAAAAWVGLGLVALNWAWTGLVAVPLHSRLSGADAAGMRRLVRINWVRTAAWTARGLLLLAALPVA